MYLLHHAEVVWSGRDREGLSVDLLMHELSDLIYFDVGALEYTILDGC